MPFPETVTVRTKCRDLELVTVINFSSSEPPSKNNPYVVTTIHGKPFNEEVTINVDTDWEEKE